MNPKLNGKILEEENVDVMPPRASRLKRIEGEIIFGFANPGDILCLDADEAQLVVDCLYVSMSTQDVFARYTILHEAGTDLTYSFNIIDPYHQEFTVCVDKMTYEHVWNKPSYWAIEQRHQVKYLTANAREIIPGVWHVEGRAAIHIRRGYPERRHIHVPVMFSPQSLYSGAFLQGLFAALDRVKECQFVTIQPGKYTCAMTSQFQHDVQSVPIPIQNAIQERLSQLSENPFRSNPQVQLLEGFFDLFRVEVLDSYWILYVLEPRISPQKLCLLRAYHETALAHHKSVCNNS